MLPDLVNISPWTCDRDISGQTWLPAKHNPGLNLLIYISTKTIDYSSEEEKKPVHFHVIHSHSFSNDLVSIDIY